jgi:hypothetical protein
MAKFAIGAPKGGLMPDASGRTPAHTLTPADVDELEVVDTVVIEIKEGLGTNVPVSRRVHDLGFSGALPKTAIPLPLRPLQSRTC